MKPIDKLNNMERAKLLHQFFPQEIPELIVFTLSMSETIEEDKARIMERWKHLGMSANILLQLSASVRGSILKYGDELSVSSMLFAKELFLGYRAHFMIYCLEQFTVTRQHPNKRFAQQVAVFFDL